MVELGEMPDAIFRPSWGGKYRYKLKRFFTDEGNLSSMYVIYAKDFHDDDAVAIHQYISYDGAGWRGAC
jgi:hypothetical protein